MEFKTPTTKFERAAVLNAVEDAINDDPRHLIQAIVYDHDEGKKIRHPLHVDLFTTQTRGAHIRLRQKDGTSYEGEAGVDPKEPASVREAIRSAAQKAMVHQGATIIEHARVAKIISDTYTDHGHTA